MEFVSQVLGIVHKCGCRTIYLAQGFALLPCKAHEDAVLKVIQ